MDSYVDDRFERRHQYKIDTGRKSAAYFAYFHCFQTIIISDSPVSKDAFAKLTGDNKELMIIPGAVHTDLYDQVDVIPFDKMVEFFGTYLK